MIDFNTEKKYKGVICGVDEVGRGPLAGPVVACAVVAYDFLITDVIDGVKDSKLLSKAKREKLNIQIREKYKFSIGEATVKEIDEYNILNATKLAIKRAVSGLDCHVDSVLVDGNMKFDDSRFYSIIKGDLTCYSIACASIVAKVYRDKLMEEMSVRFPGYDFEKNSGYGTKFHISAIQKNGITEHHRRSFLKKYI